MSEITYKLRKLVPRWAKNILLFVWNWIHSELLLASDTYRRWFVTREMNLFRKGDGSGNYWGGKQRLRVGAFWDHGGRFSWLTRVAIERNIGLLHIPRSIYRPIFAHLLINNGYSSNSTSGEVSLQVLSHEKFKNHRVAYLRYCTGVAKTLRDIYKFDVILLPKLADDWIIDVIRGLRSTGFPVVVNDREWFITPKRMEVWPKHFQAIAKELTVECLCTATERQSLFFEQCKVPAEQIIVTGRPENDYWTYCAPPPLRSRIHPKLRSDSVVMLFFAFGAKNYLNTYYDGEERDWTPLGEDYHDVLLELLRGNDDLQIVYKIGGKPARDNFPGFESFYSQARRIGGPDSVVMLDGTYSTVDLLRCTDFVLGFQTSALIEALFTKQPIFYGAWGDLFLDHKETLMPIHRWPGIRFLESKDELFNACDRCIKDPLAFVLDADSERARTAMRESLNYKPDGNSSQRIMNVIQQVAVEKGNDSSHLTRSQ